jgi:hypothetical protein
MIRMDTNEKETDLVCGYMNIVDHSTIFIEEILNLLLNQYV